VESKRNQNKENKVADLPKMLFLQFSTNGLFVGIPFTLGLIIFLKTWYKFAKNALSTILNQWILLGDSV